MSLIVNSIMEFEICFWGCAPLHGVIDATPLGQKYFELLQQQYQSDPRPIFRDPQKYTLESFADLARQAHKILAWDWIRDHYDLEITTKLHKDIESYLARGFENIPAEHDEILHELHFALHSIESGSKRNSWLQIEWFNDAGFNITADEFPAKIVMHKGDLRLQNPYVGHHPMYLYEQNDYINPLQTCRFHDFVKPGINIVLEDGRHRFDWSRYLNWWTCHARDFLQTHGQDRLIKFTGHPVVGRITNVQDIDSVLAQPVLEFQSLEF